MYQSPDDQLNRNEAYAQLFWLYLYDNKDIAVTLWMKLETELTGSSDVQDLIVNDYALVQPFVVETGPPENPAQVGVFELELQHRQLGCFHFCTNKYSFKDTGYVQHEPSSTLVKKRSTFRDAQLVTPLKEVIAQYISAFIQLNDTHTFQMLTYINDRETFLLF